MKNKKKNRFHYGFLVFFSCCAICFSSVTLSFNTAGIFYTPASAELGIGAGLFGTYMTVQYACMSVAMIFGGKVLHRFNARIVLTVCVLMVSAGLLGMSTFTGLWQFYLSGAVIGVANSILLYLMVPTMIDRWFKERVGFFVGAALCFTGIGAIIFNPIGGLIISSFGWRAGYLAFGLISLLIGLPCAAFLVRNSPKDLGLLRFGEKENEKSLDKAPIIIEGAPYKQALRSPALYLVALYAGVMDVGITLNYYLPSYVNSLGYSILAVSSVASAVMVGQLVGKLLLGYINDKSPKAGVTTAVTCGIAGIGIMTFFGGFGLIALYAGAVLFGVFFAGATVTTSLMTRGIFGSRDFSRIFSIVAMVACFCSAFSSAIWGALIDKTEGYYVTLVVGMLVMLVAYVIGFAAFRLGKKIEWAEADHSTEGLRGAAGILLDDVRL